MIGSYRLLENGNVVAESRNVITNDGARVILRYLAGQTPNIAGAIVVGTNPTTAARTDTELGFEFARGAVNFSTPDFLSETVMWKATLPTGISGSIRELGIYPTMTGPAEGYDSRLITGFESTYEPLTGGSIDITNVRVGSESYSVAPAANGNSTITLSATQGDFSGFGASDQFALAYFTNNAFAGTIRIRFLTDATNYYEYTLTAPTTIGYNVGKFLKSAATRTALGDWANITSIEFRVTALAGGAASVTLDGFRINDKDLYVDYALVSRSVLTTPYVKVLNQELDVEYSIGFDL